MNPKIAEHHRSRSAYVYLRQSTPGQVLHHQESTERQYALREKAQENPQGPLTAIRLGNLYPQHRLGLVPSCLQIRRYYLEKRCHALSLHFFQAHAIDAGTASVGFHFLPSSPQYIGPEYAVIERVEPSLPTLLGRQV